GTPNVVDAVQRSRIVDAQRVGLFTRRDDIQGPLPKRALSAKAASISTALAAAGAGTTPAATSAEFCSLAALTLIGWQSSPRGGAARRWFQAKMPPARYGKAFRRMTVR